MRPARNALLGSGLRAASLLKHADDVAITLHTRARRDDAREIQAKIGPDAVLENHEATTPVRFEYSTPLSVPTIYPRADAIERPRVRVGAKNALVFGMVDMDPVVDADRTVFDPQSPANPRHFASNGSAAGDLVVVLNATEACRLAGENQVEKAARRVLTEAHANAVVVKRGVRGADVYTAEGTHHEDALETRRVFPIGSGDVFSAAFAYQYLVRSGRLDACARFAAGAVAKYFENGGYVDLDPDVISSHKAAKFRPGKAYLAGPFFSVAEQWLIEEVRRALMDAGLDVASPLHDVGRGSAADVVRKDLRLLDACDRVFAILDNVDPGTVYEVGYAQKAGIPVVAFFSAGNADGGAIDVVEGDERLKMVVGGANTHVYSDLSTAIAKVCMITNA